MEISINLNEKQYKQILEYSKYNNITPKTLCENYVKNTLEEIEEATKIIEDPNTTYLTREELA